MYAMLEFIAMWGGIAGCAASLIAIIVVCVIKFDVKHALNSNRILFDQNFEIKKKSLEKAMNLLDELTENASIVATEEFKKQANDAYNQLLCCLTKAQIAEVFKHYAIDANPISKEANIQFKMICRKDFGFKTKVKKIKIKAVNNASAYKPYERENVVAQPIQPIRPVQPEAPAMVEEPAAVPTQPRPMPRPMAPNGVRPVQRPAAPNGVGMQRPVGRPAGTQPAKMRRTDND